MIIYNDTFSWDGSRTSGKTTVCWWPGSYRIKIIDVALVSDKIKMVKPYICIFSNTGEGTSIVNHTQNFLKRICEEFGLTTKNTLFIEFYPDRELYEVVSVTRSFHIGTDTLFSVKRRDIMPNEIKFLEYNLLV